MARSDNVKALAHKLVARLEARRDSMPNGYFIPLQTLIDEACNFADNGAAEAANKAVKNREFKRRVVSANPNDPQAPVALLEDLKAFAESPQLLGYLKSRTTPRDDGTYVLGDLKKGIAGGGKAADLKRMFDSAMQQKITSGAAPGVLLRQPPARRPSAAEIAAQVAENLVKVLESQRPLGSGAYPATLRRLAELADLDPQRDAKKILSAAASRKFQQHALVVGAKDLDALAVMIHDVGRLAEIPQVLESALRAARTKTKRLHKPDDLAKKVFGSKNENSELRKQFAAAMVKQCHADALPPTIGAIAFEDGPQFFLIDDLLPASLRRRAAETSDRGLGSRGGAPVSDQRPSQPTPETAKDDGAAPAPANTDVTLDGVYEEFVRKFEEAFSRLDRQHGGYNFVSLAELRRELGSYSRAEFDQGLRRLRIEGRFTLSGAQSKQGLSDEVREAGINEAGHLLTYASRRK